MPKTYERELLKLDTLLSWYLKNIYNKYSKDFILLIKEYID